MTWHHQIDFDQCGDAQGKSHHPMTPGLTDTYDDELRDKASAHTPPAPPECMGLEGEYDPLGLVHRLAEALDHDTRLSEIPTLRLSQQGSTICISGQVDNDLVIDRIVDIARHLDGTRAVNVDQVSNTHAV